MTAIRCEGLVKRYERGTVTALDGLDFEVSEGSVFGFVGPNGAGKTTTIRIFTGLVSPTAGSAWVFGEPVTRASPRLASLVGCLDQSPRYYPWMTGRELLVFVAETFGAGREEARRRADELLELSGLSKAGGRRIRGYSGGMLQRLGVAQALAGNPRVLFLDEPCSSLDPIGRKEVLEFIARLHGSTTVFMSTHILADVERVCDTVGIIDHGRMLAVDRTEEMARRLAPPVLECEFENPDAAEAFRVLMQQQAVRMQLDARTVKATGEDLGRVRSAAIRAVASGDLPLIRMEVRAASLEDVFVRLVGNEPHEPKPGGTTP